MKFCPTCRKSFNDEHLSFCVDDGTPLVASPAPEDEATVVRPAAENQGRAASSAGSAAAPPASVPPGSFGQSQRRTWPWIVGILAIVFVVFAGLGIAAAVLIPRVMRAANSNTNINANVERRGNSNANLNSRNLNANTNSGDANANDANANRADLEDTTPAPTDQAEVLSTLTDLEHEWTAANINADKKKLDRILADDYVGTSDGKAQGKAEYLKTIKRDTAIQKWAFEDLKVSLKGDRATLNGNIRLDVRDQAGETQSPAFHFTDKFIWRDGRWQATGSEVEPLKR